MPYRLLQTARVVFLVGVFLIAGSTVRAADPTPGITVIGGVADPPNKVVYLSDPAGSVVAVDIDKGTVLWESKEATRAVAALGKYVYAFAPEKGKTNVFRVVTLDAGEKGKVVRTSDPVTLPDWVDVGDALDRFIGPKIFQCSVELDSGVAKLRWEAFSRAAKKSGFGEASVELATGKVTTAAGKHIPFAKRKHSEEVTKVIYKRSWNSADPIVAAGERVFGRTGGSKGDAWVLTVQVADLKSGDLLWKRVIQEVRAAPDK
jgi:hypothetical protein